MDSLNLQPFFVPGYFGETGEVFNFVPIPIAITEANTNVISYMNESFCTMLGRSRTDLIGTQWDHITFMDDIPAMRTELNSFRNGSVDKIYYEKRYVRPDGSIVWAGITLFRSSEPEKQAYYIVVANNITGVKKKDELLFSRTHDLFKARETILSSMAILSEFRDRETGEHIIRTRLYVNLLLENFPGPMPFSQRAVALIASSAILHDIGKVGIPDNILLKPGKLTADEFETMKTHTTLGAMAIARTQQAMEKDSFLVFAKEIAEYHHEKWDGSGYPYGLAGAEIPLTARVMAIADVYDALRSDRPYKKAMPHEDAVRIIMSESGTHFDPVLANLFYSNRDEFSRIASTEKEHLAREIDTRAAVYVD